ncbi:uncharacterized protein LOC132088129 isoform X2 [Daphnia carinata]|uniref:uncharacterized protein LOC132088129 isoform X2 n=1 Tax=Daphnia carinata TaxID=120202 RepID=UPI002868FB67|nr:uncharacterized protein LOC132088129 isoform X2 [Daphnia carinata]
MGLANRCVFYWCAAAIWLFSLDTGSAKRSEIDELLPHSADGEFDEDLLDNWMHGNVSYEPISQSAPPSAGSSDISDLAPISQPVAAVQEDLEKLFHQFRMLHFRMKTLNETTVYLEWTIMNATNGLDSDRLLNISEINNLKTELITLNQRVTMGKHICHKYSDLMAKCNFTVPVKSCSNFQFRLGGERNTEYVTTVDVDPQSLREDLSEMANAPAKLRWKITCDADFMMPVFVTLADIKTSVPKQERLNATCANRTCITMTDKLRTSPCSQYSLKIDGSDLRIVNTPPTTKNLSAEVIPWKFQYLLRWSISPVNCPFDPVLMVAKTNSFEKPVFSKLTLKAPPSDFCSKGFCEYVYEVDPCVTSWIKSSNSNTSSLKLLRPSVLELASVFNGDLDNPVRFSWKLGCHSERKNFSIALTDEITRERYFSNVSTNCDDDSRRCGAYLSKDRNGFLPCNRYEMEMEGSHEVLNIETPPPSTVSIRPLTSSYTTNGTLIISVSFERIQESCGRWKNAIELQFFDLPSKPMVLPCENNEATIPFRKNCTVFVQIVQPNLICRPKLNIAIRPLYSKPELSFNVYKGNWFNAIIEPTKPESWSGVQALSDLFVKANAIQQSMAVDWRNPICFMGTATSPTNLSIILSGMKASEEYHLTIPSQCSRSNRNPTKSSVIFNNGQITCSDGKLLPDKDAINLTPCTNYSLSLTPMITGDAASLSRISITTTFTTEFIPLEFEDVSSNNMKFVASHSNGEEWALKLNVQKERCPCDDRIISATFKIPGAKLIEQTVPCNKNIICEGIVEFNHLNLCQPLAVTVGLQYPKVDTDQVFWFNETLSPLVENTGQKGSFPIELEVHQVERRVLQMKWKDPACLNGVPFSWNMEFRQNNGNLHRVLRIPYNCSGIGEESPGFHRVDLKGGQLECYANRQLHDIGLSPCTDYTLLVTPVVKGKSPAELLEFSQSISFTSPFGPSNVGDVKIVNVTSNNFELHLTIPSQCVDSAEIDVEVNGTVFSIEPSDNAPGSSVACDEEKCQISHKIIAGDVSLAPCSDYNVRVETTNLKLTTLPGDNELEVSPDKTSVTVVIDNNNIYLDFEMVFDTFDGRCSARLVAIELQLPDVHPPVQHVLLCEVGTANEENSTAVICSGRVTVHRMDRCEALPTTFRPLYEDISFAKEVRWASKELGPLLSQLQRNEKNMMIPEVKVINGDKHQSVLMNWEEPACLLADSLSWEIRINSTADDIHRIRVPRGCSATGKGSSSFEHGVQMENGHLLACNDSTNRLGLPESNFTFLSCSSYLVSVIPVQNNSESAELNGYAQSTLLNIPFAVDVPNVASITSNLFRLEWSFPLECLYYIEMTQSTVEINGTEIEINPLILPLECDEVKCWKVWTSSENLTSCTEFAVSSGSIIQKVVTLPDPLQGQLTCDVNYATSVLHATLANDSWSALTLIIGLSMLGSVLLGLVVGIGYGIHKRKTESGKLDIKKRTNAHLNQPKALSLAENTNVTGVAF